MRTTRFRASQDDSDDDRTLSELTSVDRVRRNFRKYFVFYKSIK